MTCNMINLVQINLENNIEWENEPIIILNDEKFKLKSEMMCVLEPLVDKYIAAVVNFLDGGNLHFDKFAKRPCEK